MVRTHLGRLLSAALLLTGLSAATAVSAPARAAVDGYAGYDGQSTCASEVLPGTAYLLDHLVRTHPGTRAVSTLRACAGDNVSEHKDGRALDWGVDADVEAERRLAYAWLDKVFASDARGNEHALARRMGIMYVIWDDRIWRAYDGFQERPYAPCGDRPDCSKTLRHRDHVHVSLSRSGAAAQTTFYRQRNVPSVPVLLPRTNQLDPVGTAEVTFEVPATGRVVTTDFELSEGTGYRIVADGLVRTGPGARVADPACRWTRAGWSSGPVLRVAGTDPWGTSCTDSHTYETTFTATETGPLSLRVAGAAGPGVEGTFTFAILREDLPAATVATRRPLGSAEPRAARRSPQRGRPLKSEEVTVRAASARGVLTVRGLRSKDRYRVVVTGTAASGETLFDGQCVRYAGRWRPQHTLDLTTPAADHLALYIQGVKVPLRVPGSSRPCDGKAHRYVGVFRPVVDGRSRISIWDPYSHADNTGALTVVLRRR
ncbi:MAG: hypothetical protein ACOYX5_09410 [Actinomycetota bacterium]